MERSLTLQITGGKKICCMLVANCFKLDTGLTSTIPSPHPRLLWGRELPDENHAVDVISNLKGPNESGSKENTALKALFIVKKANNHFYLWE